VFFLASIPSGIHSTSLEGVMAVLELWQLDEIVTAILYSRLGTLQGQLGLLLSCYSGMWRFLRLSVEG
jgi:hypothetical protein